MKIRVKQTIAGPWGTFQAGEIAELPDHIALAIVGARAGEFVEEKTATAPVEIAAELSPPAPVETATLEPGETQEFPSRRRKKA
jgi:hypothetical protein